MARIRTRTYARTPRVLHAGRMCHWACTVDPQRTHVLSPQNFVQRLSFCEFIDQLVQLANLLHERVIDVFHANPAYHALDEGTVRVNGWSFGEESSEIDSLFNLP